MIVDELKKSILNFAITGNLSKTLNFDFKSDELLLKIALAKEKLPKRDILIGSKILKIENDLFDIPSTWRFVRLGTISKIISKGTTPKGGKLAYKTSGVPFVRAENVDKTINFKDDIKFIPEEVHLKELKRSILKEKDILICIAGTLGRCGVVTKKDLPLNTNQAVAFIRLVDTKLINVWYVYYALCSELIQQQLISQKKITAIPNLTLEIIINCIIPIPPLEEQQRIVDKIEELFSKLDEIKSIEEELSRLKISLPLKMNKSIIDYAIHGKLSNQNLNDSDVDSLIPEKSLLKDNYKKFNLSLLENEYPFQIPLNWKWVKLGMLFDYQNGYSYKPSETLKNGKGHPVIKSQNIMRRIVEINNQTSFVENPTSKMLKSKINKGDFLMCLSSQSNNPEPLGKTAIYEGEDFALLNQRVLKLTPINYDLSKYLYYVINSFYFHNTVSHKGGGSAQSNLKLEHVMEMYIPLPPIEEQQRIVEKLERLLPLCADIERIVDYD